MKAAMLWSGGKDSLLALDRAQCDGLEVTHLVNIYEGNSQRVRFHGVPQELIAEQARALGKTFLSMPTHPDTFEQALHKAMLLLKAEGIEAIVFGNIHLADIRAWYEARVTANGFRHVEPLWGEPPAQLIREFVARGHRSRIVSVYPDFGGKSEWLGQDFSPALIDALERTPGIDICGERGEYHSFAWGGPLFQWEVSFESVGTFTCDAHLCLDLKLSGLDISSLKIPSLEMPDLTMEDSAVVL
jgi:uncharacterized protein (TIGR00290 family)